MKALITIYLILLFLISESFSQGGPIKSLLKEDSCTIYYLANFNYDVVLLYANGIRIDENILYSQASRNARKSKFIIYDGDSIELKVAFYKRNFEHSFEFNALWSEWNIHQMDACYFPPSYCEKTIYPKRDGSNVSISVIIDETNGHEIIYRPIIECTKQKLTFE